MTAASDLAADLLDGDHAALARAITAIENRDPGYRDLVAALHGHAGDAEVLGVTGSPGAGKSTLVDRVVESYRDRGLTAGVVAVDPSSPFTGGAVLGDRVRMSAADADTGVFVRSMSARGRAGGLAGATADVVTALDAFGTDRIVIETVGAGQSEVDVVRTADAVAVLVPPSSGDDVQMLKAGILEIADVFVVNKADLDGADRTVAELRRMIREADGDWTPPIVETVATEGDGVDDFLDAVADHRTHLASTGGLAARRRDRWEATIRADVRRAVDELVADEIDAAGGLDALVDRVADREIDPHAAADAVLDPVRERLDGECDADR